MQARLRWILPLLVCSISNWAVADDTVPPQPGLAPRPLPPSPLEAQPGAGNPGPPTAPGAPGMPPQTGMPGAPGAPLPHQGNLPNAPTSAASKRDTERPTVTIREFRSTVAEVTPRGATDMFMSALVRTRKFRVVERARMAEGIATEKALNQQGMTTSQVGQGQYVGATYLFEAAVSEASVGESKSGFALGLLGATASKGTASDSIAIDVRVIDVESGVVVDAVNVRKQMQTVESKLEGVGTTLLGLFTKGRSDKVVQNLQAGDAVESVRKDSVDRALRLAIEEAVGEIARRFAPD